MDLCFFHKELCEYKKSQAWKVVKKENNRTVCWWQAYHNVQGPGHLVTLRRFKRPKHKFPSPFCSCGKGPPAKEPTLSYRLGKGLLLSRGFSSLPACRISLTRTLLLVQWEPGVTPSSHYDCSLQPLVGCSLPKHGPSCHVVSCSPRLRVYVTNQTAAELICPTSAVTYSASHITLGQECLFHSWGEEKAIKAYL